MVPVGRSSWDILFITKAFINLPRSGFNPNLIRPVSNPVPPGGGVKQGDTRTGFVQIYDVKRFVISLLRSVYECFYFYLICLEIFRRQHVCVFVCVCVARHWEILCVRECVVCGLLTYCCISLPVCARHMTNLQRDTWSC